MDIFQIKIGTPIIYWGIINETGEKFYPTKTEITSEPWILGHGAVVCKVKGKSGGIMITHLDLVTPGSFLAAQLAGCEGVTKDNIKEESEKFFSERGVGVIVTVQ